MKKPSKIISVRIPGKLYEQIKKELNKNKLTISEWIIIRIGEHERFLKSKARFDKYLEELQKVFKNDETLDGETVVNHLKKFF